MDHSSPGFNPMSPLRLDRFLRMPFPDLRGRTCSFVINNCCHLSASISQNLACRRTYRNRRWFTSATSGVQTIELPESGHWQISVYGARGGYSANSPSSYLGGFGAKVVGVFEFEANTTLKVGVSGQAVVC